MTRTIVVFCSLVFASPLAASDTVVLLLKECERVYQVYPRLMMTVMLEGDLDCGEPGGEYESCNEGETAEEKIARERRLAVRKRQEASYKPAQAACRIWDRYQQSTTHQLKALEAIKSARKSDNWRPDEVEEPGEDKLKPAE